MNMKGVFRFILTTGSNEGSIKLKIYKYQQVWLCFFSLIKPKSYELNVQHSVDNVIVLFKTCLLPCKNCKIFKETYRILTFSEGP